jgi:hypothetical protein
VRDLRKTPEPVASIGYGNGSVSYGLSSTLTPDAPPERKPVWPWGLAFDVLVAVGALWLTTRRLVTPTRRLPKGQRVA